eukprot:1139322-Pelagomonas_calceolata.AAC.1
MTGFTEFEGQKSPQVKRPGCQGMFVCHHSCDRSFAFCQSVLHKVQTVLHSEKSVHPAWSYRGGKWHCYGCKRCQGRESCSVKS